MDGRASLSAPQPAMTTAFVWGPGVTGRIADFSSGSRAISSLGLTCKRLNLKSGLPLMVIETSQNAIALSTCSFYDGKWYVFEGWCSEALPHLHGRMEETL